MEAFPSCSVFFKFVQRLNGEQDKNHTGGVMYVFLFCAFKSVAFKVECTQVCGMWLPAAWCIQVQVRGQLT